MKEQKVPLWTKNYILAFVSNMMIFFSFYMLVPILPFYLLNDLHLDESSTGVILALYTIAALLIRPLSGFLVDKFSRKPLYILCYSLFAIVFAGYALTQIVSLFVILRILHGFGFGLSTVSGSTIAIDVMPAQRRGEGIGYFGLSYTLAQSLGPLTGFWLYSHYDFSLIFLIAFGFACIGLISIFPISLSSLQIPKPAEVDEPLSLDRFILVKGLPCILLLLLVGYGYGTLSNFIGLYCQGSSFSCDPGLFFLIFAVGVVVSRLLSAKAINRDKVVEVALIGAVLIAIAYFILAYCTSSWLFFIGSAAVGIGFGCVNPAFQSLLINLAPHNRRGTANATFYTFFDLGIGGGIALGGVIIEHFDFTTLLSACAALILLGALYFKFVSASYYQRNKLVEEFS
ncbi:MAG: MFS transporter [Rikenellaceae bacterium]